MQVRGENSDCLVLRDQLPILRSLCYCVNLGWMSILVGTSGSGKSGAVKTLANLAGKTLKTFPVTSAMDTTDILGGFEQTDYSRHLDELHRKTEAILTDRLRSLLLSKKIEEAVAALRLWESLQRLQEQEIKTIKEEIQLFIRKLDKLNAVWDYIEGLKGSAENAIEGLRRKEKVLRKNVQDERSLNAGGKFEWVDSVLIKCLQNGYWLLVDNVNLCSSAVLDRLNALLEPRGVLTIGERGVDKDGRMMEVKPHPDFRLFLTMDPKNGEISRAMRNRGVEIYLLNDREKTRNELDLKSMIQINGLKDRKHIRVLLHMHDHIGSLILSEQPTVNELIQSAILISQQLKYGVEETQAFHNTLLEVYYKTRSPVEFNTKEMDRELMEELGRVMVQSEEVEDDWYNENFTVKTDTRKVSSELKKFQQESALIHSVLGKYVRLDNSNLLEYLVSIFYSRSTPNDLETRHDYLRYLLDDQGLSRMTQQMFEILKHSSFEVKGLPVDHRWLPDTVYRKKNSSDANATLLKLFLTVQYYLDEKLKKAKKPKVALLDYLMARRKNEIGDKFNDVIVTEFLCLLEAFDENLRSCLLREDIRLNDEEVIFILYVMVWRFSFSNCALVDVTDKKEHSKILTNLKVHYNWFLKYSVKDTMRTLRQQEDENLGAILSRINHVMDKQSSGLFKIGKNYQKHINIPPPFTQASSIVTSEEFEFISQFYNICDRRNDFKTVLGRLNSGSNLRNILTDLKVNLTYNFDSVSDKMDVLRLAHAKEEVKELDRYKLELVPFTHYLEELEVRRVVASKVKEANAFYGFSMVPTDLVATCVKYAKTRDERLVHELLKCYFLYMVNSPSGYLEEYLEEKDESTYVTLSGYHPKLSFYLSKLLMRNDAEDMNTTKLGNFRDLMNQHRTLNVALWKNVKALHGGDYDFINIESNYLKMDLQTFSEQLGSSFNIDSTTSTLAEVINKCAVEIESFQTSVTSSEHREAIIKFAETLRTCCKNTQKLSELPKEKTNENLALISAIHVQLGYLKLILNSQLHLIDPLAKKAIKKGHLEQAIRDFEGLKRCFELQNKVFGATCGTMHPLHGPIKEMVDRLTLKTRSLGEYVAVRSEKVQYESVFMVIKNTMSSILSKESFLKIEDLSTVLEDLIAAINENKTISLTDVQKLLSRCEPSVKTYENTVLEWSRYRISYPDIVEPLLANMAQFLYGYKMKVSLLRKLFEQCKFRQINVDVGETMSSLVKYPVLDVNQQDYVGHVSNYCDENMQGFLDFVLSQEKHKAEVEKLRLLKCGIQESFNACVIYSAAELLDATVYEKFIKLIEIFVVKYTEQEQRKEEEKQEEENLYKMKTKCKELTEDEEVEEEIKELFTNYHSIDFADMQPRAQLTDDPESLTREEEEPTEISYEDLKFVSDLHSTLVQNFTKSEWLKPEKNKGVFCDFVRPLMQKLKVFRHLVDKVVRSLDYEMDKELFGSFSVLLGVVQKYGKEDALEDQEGSPTRHSKNQYTDFYKDSDVDEVKSCYHILEELRLRIEELLDEWPEQPTLKTIVEVVNRIYDFNINSPVSRFLTGFEILLNKCHEWEQVAHSGVSLSQFEQNIIHQIIEWRKKELAMWKNLLNSSFEKLNSSKAKWWLYLFRVTQQFIIEKLFTVEELIATLQRFITNSNLAEFHMRLDLLRTFHCFAVNFKDAENRSEALIYQNVLWNLHQYYAQFEDCVAVKIKELRAPVEKKLRDYVKIVKWKDISYWSVKETVDKTHKILHKHVREFKDIMTQPVAKFLTHTNTNGNKEENVGIWDRPQRHSPKKYHYTMDSSNYVARKSNATKNSEETADVSTPIQGVVLPKMNSYFNKSRTLCKTIVEATKYPELVKDMDEFVAELIQTSTHLQNLEVDATLPKSKQKSQAKNILQQKHRALADLFKTLGKMGLSFKTGIVDNSTKNCVEEFTLKPVDLTASFAHVGANRNDDKILTIWDSCELYFLRSLVRFNTLEGAVLQPAKDLGVSNIERCKGYTAHLLSLSRQQKSEMIEMSRSVYYLRHCFNNLSRYCNSAKFLDAEYLENLSDLMKKLTVVSKQYKIILNTFPEEDVLNITQIQVVELNNKSDFPKYKYDSTWNKLFSSFNTILEISNKVQAIIGRCQSKVPCLEFDWKEPKMIPVEDGQLISSNLEVILEKSKDILTLVCDTHLQNSLKWLFNEVTKAKNEFNLKSTTKSEESETNKLRAKIEQSSSKILLVIQEIYKKYSKTTKDQSEDADKDDKQKNLEEEHLKTKLVESLLSDIEELNSKNVLKSVKKVTECLLSGKLPLDENCKIMTGQYLSLLEQIILLYQYFLTQQVSSYRVTCKLNSVLLNIFIELAGKGFCVPPELSDEEQGPGKPSDGMGLGDGTGEKDVSDKIESEDQLDDAQVEGKEKEKEEDPDCKEEDNAIEMNRDLDSKVQDVEKKENEDDEDEEEDNEDAEELMDKTEKDSQKLEKEIWESDGEEDDDENEEEEGNQEEENGNEGEDEQDQQIGAKEKESKNQPKDKEETGEEQKGEQKDIEQNEEPEVDEQTNPYHKDLPEPPEPEPMDLPDDLQLDEGEAEDKEEQPEENPFDIDAMKEQNIPEEQEEPTPEETEEKQKDEVEDFDSDDEEIKKGDKDEESQEDNEEQDEQKQDEIDKEREDKVEESKIEEDAEEEKEGDEEMNEQSAADQTQSQEDQVEAMEVEDSEAADKTQGAESDKRTSQPIDELHQEDKPDQDGMGQSQMEESQTGHSAQTDQPQEADTSVKDKQDLKRKERPGESDTQRSLGDVNAPVQKKLKTMEAEQEDESSKQPEDDQNAKAEMYKHIKEAEEKATQVLDVATKEQAEAQKEQPVPSKEEEEAEEPTESSQDLPEEEEENMEVTEGQKQKPEKVENQKDKKKESKSHPEGDVLEEIDNVEVDGEVVETSTVARAPESSHHTHFEDETEKVESGLSMEAMNSLRLEVEQQMSSWYEPPSDVDAEQTWQKISSVTSSLAQELSEQLRLVLEPTQASRLKGDYRTGRRINMRKVIPYIASQFRKDKIWLRRTKPSKREYQIVLAIDDSSSMANNKSKEMAFESVALISKALTLLESGQLSILSFGEQTEVLHKLTDQFTEKSGVKLLQKFKFDQTKTRLAKMVDFATEMLNLAQIQSNSLTAKLLIIISDGHGVFSEGETVMRQAVRRGKLANIFTVFVIIDNPENKHSVLDIRKPVFKDGKLEKIDNYMDAFPFSFYILLRDLVSLPNVLSDALRQWFEMVSNLDK